MSEDKSYLEQYYENDRDDGIDKITIPEYAFERSFLMGTVNNEPVHMKPVELGLNVIKNGVSDKFFHENLEKYYKVVGSGPILEYDWSNEGGGDVRAYVCRNNDSAVLFILERKGFYNELKEICFGKYCLDRNKRRVIEVEFWVCMKEFIKELPFDPLFPWRDFLED